MGMMIPSSLCRSRIEDIEDELFVHKVLMLSCSIGVHCAVNFDTDTARQVPSRLHATAPIVWFSTGQLSIPLYMLCSRTAPRVRVGYKTAPSALVMSTRLIRDLKGQHPNRPTMQKGICRPGSECI